MLILEIDGTDAFSSIKDKNYVLKRTFQDHAVIRWSFFVKVLQIDFLEISGTSLGAVIEQRYV